VKQIEILINKIQWQFLAKFLPILLLVVSSAPEQRTLVDDLGMTKTQMGSITDQKMVAVAWDTLYDNTL
jgi:hypothetical protein